MTLSASKARQVLDLLAYNILKEVSLMYIVTLGSLPSLQYETIEQAWGSRYLDARRGCFYICDKDCHCCRAFQRFKEQLGSKGVVKLHAATVYAEGV